MKKENIYNNIIPYSSKYWEENPLLGRWFIWGEGGGTADISDGEGDVFVKVPVDFAKRICKARQEFVDKIEEINRELGGSRRVYEKL